MRLLKPSIVTVLLIFFMLKFNAQQPSHFIIGEEDLSGIDIYNIAQDKFNNYWLATNEGIIKYDGYSFKSINSPSMLSTSVFDFQFDNKNILYCKNMSGQIFKIENNTCSLFFTIPDSLMNHDVYYSFNKNNELVIVSNTIFKVIKNKVKSIGNQKSNSRYSQLFKTNDDQLITQNYTTNQLIKIKNNKLQIQQIDTNRNIFIQNFYLDSTLYYFDKKSGRLLNNDNLLPNYLFIPNENRKDLLRYYSDNKNLWVAKQPGGIKVFDKNLHPLYGGKTIFKGRFISSFLKDKEGNIILGTFGEGLIIISNFNSNEIIIPDVNSKTTRVTAGKYKTIYLGTQNGKIFKVDSNKNVSLFLNKQAKNIEILEYIDETNQLLVDDQTPILININTSKETKPNLGSVKDIFRIEKNTYLVAYNRGLDVINFGNNTFKNKMLPHFKGRTNSVGFNQITKTIYAGSSLGLKLGNMDSSYFFKLNNKPVLCRDVLYWNKKIYITTQNNGVLIFENDKLIDNWTTKNGLLSNNTKQIKTSANKIFLSTNKGIQILKENGKILFTLNKSEGLYTNNIVDFEIQDNLLWLVHQKGVQTIEIDKIKPQDFIPTIKFTSIVVNDSILVTQKKNNFSYTQNKFNFTISSNSIKHNNEIKYLYQLEGFDNDWQKANYKDNEINYKVLQPGKYSFKIKAIYRNEESDTIYYKFTINTPFWSTWWFYSIIIVLFLISTIIIFKYQLKKQKKKIKLQNELNAAKLIAIQSQMNPHFIFNTINSIQDLILKGDIDNSYNYIIKLSKLVRQTLNFSDKDFIDIEDEVELLKIYLDLEKLRFKEDLTYNILMNDINDIQIPPMLIQPFVENAIKHGLLHKEGQKTLTISFEVNDVIICKVSDNGVGRKKAQEIKDRQTPKHQSFSVNATKTRFDIMKTHYKQNLGIAYKDIVVDGIVDGTEVTIILPINRRY